MAFVDGAASTKNKATQRGEDPWGIGGTQVREVVEGLVSKVWKEVKGEEVDFKVMPYEIAMDVVS